MAMILDYAPGSSLTDPLAFSVSARNKPSYRVGANGLLSLVSGSAFIDNHYINGVRTTLFECPSTNSLLQSQAWATSPWANNVVTATNNNAISPTGDGTGTSLLPNNTGGANNPYVSQGSIAITSGENIAASFFVKQNGYLATVLRCADSGSTNGFQVSFDLNAGTFGTLGNGFGAGVLTGKLSVALPGGWYWVGLWGQINAAVTSASVFCYVYDTIAHANTQTAYTANGSSGIRGWGAQLERWGTLVPGLPTSLIPTTTLAQGRSAATTSLLWPFQPAPLWGYAKFFDLGWSQRANFEPLVEWADASGANPSAKLFTGSGTGGSTPNHRMNYASSVGTNQSAAPLTPGVNYGDVVELFFRMFGDASVELQRRVNGGAVTVNLNAGASPDFFDFGANAAPAPTFWMNVSASVGLTRLKIGAGTSLITTLAQGAAA